MLKRTDAQTLASKAFRVSAAASFEQAKNPAQEPQFLQIVAKPERGAPARPSGKRSPNRS